MSKSAQILEILNERYVCGAVPVGALTAIGNEVGATRELVRQVANKNGFTGRIKKAPERRLCRAGCGEEAASGKQYCAGCGVIPVACATCGALSSRPRGVVLRHASDDRYKVGNFFCSKVCFGRWSGTNRGWGSDAHPHSATRGTHGIWGHRNGCRCGVCVAAFKAKNHRAYERWKARRVTKATD